MSTIKTLDDFLDVFPDAEWLEDSEGHTRYSNGLDEGTDHESEWFDIETGNLITNHWEC